MYIHLYIQKVINMAKKQGNLIIRIDAKLKADLVTIYLLQQVYSYRKNSIYKTQIANKIQLIGIKKRQLSEMFFSYYLFIFFGSVLNTSTNGKYVR